MAVDFESFNDVLKHPIRRKIIIALGNNKTLSYVELLNITEASNTGKFNYHLKVLGDLIEKDNSGKYNLTEKGQLALEFLQKFPEKPPQPQTSLHMADAALIGLVGFALIVANPVLWFGAWLDLTQNFVPFFALPIFGLCTLLYGWFVPSAFMRFLTIKRTRSHDIYTLLRAPLVTFVILLAVIAIMFLTDFKYNIVAEIKTPLIMVNQGVNWTQSSQQMTIVSLVPNLMQGLVYSFLGVVIIELAGRARKKLGRD